MRAYAHRCPTVEARYLDPTSKIPPRYNGRRVMKYFQIWQVRCQMQQLNQELAPGALEWGGSKKRDTTVIVSGRRHLRVALEISSAFFALVSFSFRSLSSFSSSAYFSLVLFGCAIYGFTFFYLRFRFLVLRHLRCLLPPLHNPCPLLGH